MTNHPVETCGMLARQSWRKNLQCDPSVAKKACSVCPPHQQQGQGDKLVGSSPTVPRLLHHDGMTTRGYLAVFTAKIQYNAWSGGNGCLPPYYALQRRCVRLSRRESLGLAFLGDHSGDSNLESMQASRVGQLGRK